MSKMETAVGDAPPVLKPEAGEHAGRGRYAISARIICANTILPIVATG
jgi:hypothetical protein